MARPPIKQDLEELFAKRAEIDRALAEQMADVAILFTDIVGSTEYFERKGDVEGLALLKRHNDLLFPVVYKNRGKIIKTIGDAIMAIFESSPDAVNCAIEMQRALAEAPGDPITIKIGVHAGKALVHREGDKVLDVFGDTVNTTARIASRAQGDEVLASESLYLRMPREAGLRSTRRGALELKGKAEALSVVAIHWRENHEDVFEPTPMPGSVPSATHELFVLEMGMGPNGIKVSAMNGQADKGTVKAYEEVPLDRGGLDALASRFATFMHGGGAGASYIERVREHGGDLFEKSLSKRARQQIGSTPLRFLRLHLDDDLTHVPWELMHDGKDFLALRFAMGRMVTARAGSGGYRAATGEDDHGHVLVVSNPSGDLPAAAREGKAVAGLLKEGFAGEVRHVDGPMTRAAFFAALKGCRVLHFAGHAQRAQGKVRGGFRLSDGIATPEEIADAVGRRAPALVFANSCHASTGDGWTETAQGVFNIASALLMRGTQHFIGPMWEVPDEDALAFALRFYEGTLSGVPFGEAARAGRESLSRTHRQPLSFAGYVLYGDPRTSLSPQDSRLAGAERTRSTPSPSAWSTEAPPMMGAVGQFSTPITPDSPDVAGGAKGKKGKKKSIFKIRHMLLILGLGAATAEVTGISISDLIKTAMGRGPAATTASITGASGTLGVGAEKSGAPAATPAKVAFVAAKERHEGPLRITVLPFKNLTKDPKDTDVNIPDALQEAVLTDLLDIEGIRLVEHAQINMTVLYQDETTTGRYDPTFYAELGKLAGAEVVVMGAYQRLGKDMRANARLVNVETGDILETLKVERGDGKVLDLQDDLAAEIRKAIPPVRTRLRPTTP